MVRWDDKWRSGGAAGLRGLCHRRGTARRESAAVPRIIQVHLLSADERVLYAGQYKQFPV